MKDALQLHEPTDPAVVCSHFVVWGVIRYYARSSQLEYVQQFCHKTNINLSSSLLRVLSLTLLLTTSDNLPQLFPTGELPPRRLIFLGLLDY